MTRIRIATRADFEAVRRIFRDASLSNRGDRASLLKNPDSLVFSPDALGEGRTTVATDAGGTIVGFATTSATAEGLELDDLFVDPAWMRRGVGRLLIAGVVERGGAAIVRVTANPHAMEFYLSVGFVPDGMAQTQFGPAQRMRLDTAPYGTGPSA